MNFFQNFLTAVRINLFQIPLTRFPSTELKTHLLPWSKLTLTLTRKRTDEFLQYPGSLIYQCKYIEMNQLVQRLDKTNSDSLWNQTFLISWKGAQMTRLGQHLENTSIKKNDYYKINLDSLARTLLISKWTNCSQRVKQSGSLWLVHRNSNFKMSNAGIFSFFSPQLIQQRVVLKLI